MNHAAAELTGYPKQAHSYRVEVSFGEFNPTDLILIFSD